MHGISLSTIYFIENIYKKKIATLISSDYGVNSRIRLNLVLNLINKSIYNKFFVKINLIFYNYYDLNVCCIYFTLFFFGKFLSLYLNYIIFFFDRKKLGA